MQSPNSENIDEQARPNAHPQLGALWITLYFFMILVLWIQSARLDEKLTRLSTALEIANARSEARLLQLEFQSRLRANAR